MKTTSNIEVRYFLKRIYWNMNRIIKAMQNRLSQLRRSMARETNRNRREMTVSTDSHHSKNKNW